ncbi:MAG: hypothetical protein ACPGJV_03850 [Bacteriovoracaceae bacterium]
MKLKHTQKFDSFIQYFFICAFFGLLIYPTFNLSALELWGAKVLNISESGKTMKVAVGHLDGVRPGTYAKVFRQTGTKNNPKLHLVGTAEVVQSRPRSSFWYFERMDHAALIEEGNSIKIATLKRSLKGRTLKVSSRKVILPEGKSVKRYILDEDQGMPSELVFKSKDYSEDKGVIRTSIDRNEHMIARNFEVWQRKQGIEYIDEYLNDVNLKKSTDQANPIDVADIERRENKKIFNSTIDGVQDKMNKLEFGVTGLYKEQEKDEQISQVTKKVQLENVYEKKIRERREARHVGPYALERIRRRGDRWSSDMNDEELRRFFVQSGIEKERRRQELALDRRAGNEILLRMTTALVANTAVDDSNNQGMDYALSLGYEYHLSRTSFDIKKWTIELQAEIGLRYYDIGGLNGKFNERSFLGVLNYYFYNRPDQVRKYLIYAGLGLRRGEATMSNPNLTRDYNYQLVTLPTTQIGLKYRFQAGDEREDGMDVGMGANILIQNEVSRYNATDEIEDDIESLVISNNFRMSFGLSLYF